MTSPSFMLIGNSSQLYIQSSKKNKNKKGIKWMLIHSSQWKLFLFYVIEFDGGCFVCVERKARADAWCSHWSSSLKFKHLSNMVVHEYFWLASSGCVTAWMALKFLYEHIFFPLFSHTHANTEEILLLFPLSSIYATNLTRCLVIAVSECSW